MIIDTNPVKYPDQFPELRELGGHPSRDMTRKRVGEAAIMNFFDEHGRPLGPGEVPEPDRPRVPVKPSAPQAFAQTIRQLLGLDFTVLKRYFALTSYAVLVLICLHPGLLVYQRFRDGFGLPPGSVGSYVGPRLGWLTLLGLVSLLVFLAYELHRWYK